MWVGGWVEPPHNTSCSAALGRGPVSLVAPLVACYPLATLVFGWAFPGGSPLSRQAVVGIGITVAGVAILLSL